MTLVSEAVRILHSIRLRPSHVKKNPAERRGEVGSLRGVANGCCPARIQLPDSEQFDP